MHSANRAIAMLPLFVFFLVLHSGAVGASLHGEDEFKLVPLQIEGREFGAVFQCSDMLDFDEDAVDVIQLPVKQAVKAAKAYLVENFKLNAEELAIVEIGAGRSHCSAHKWLYHIVFQNDLQQKYSVVVLAGGRVPEILEIEKAKERLLLKRRGKGK